MSYRNLTQTLANIELYGYKQYADELLFETSRGIIIPFEYTIRLSNIKETKRLMKLLYEMLYFYPTQKSRCSLKLENEALIIKIRDKTEKRGRKGRKSE